MEHLKAAGVSISSSPSTHLLMVSVATDPSHNNWVIVYLCLVLSCANTINKPSVFPSQLLLPPLILLCTGLNKTVRCNMQCNSTIVNIICRTLAYIKHLHMFISFTILKYFAFSCGVKQFLNPDVGLLALMRCRKWENTQILLRTRTYPHLY